MRRSSLEENYFEWHRYYYELPALHPMHWVDMSLNTTLECGYRLQAYSVYALWDIIS